MKKKEKLAEQGVSPAPVPICERIQKLEEHMKEVDEVWMYINRYEDDLPDLSSSIDGLKKKLAAQGIQVA
jgi:hypothetical protein